MRNTIKAFSFILLFVLGMMPMTITANEDDKQRQKLVVGGQPADPGEYPFMVALMSPGTADGYNAHYCGGALIDPEWVLTAAHCLETPTVDIGLGFHDLTNSPGNQRIVSSAIYLHPSYNAGTSDNDIALIKLSSPATGYQLADYATSDAQHPADRVMIATGWGALSQGGSFPTVLYEVDLPIISNTDCNAWGQNGAVTANMLCAGYKVGGKDTCQGDSGGPLFYYESGVPVLVGATSWGDGCAKPDSPGVYARVSYFTDWIESYVGASNITPTPSATPDPNVSPTATPTATMTPSPTTAPDLDAYENDNDVNNASPIVNGETQNHSTVPAGDQDWVTFTLNGPSAVTLLTDGPTGDTTMTLYDSNGNQIEFDDDDGADTFSEIARTCGVNPLPAGAYTVLIQGYYADDEIVDYTLSFDATACGVTPTPSPIPPVDSYEPDDLSTTISEISDGETQIHSILPVGDQDFMTFTLTDESAVNILTSGTSGGDTRLYLYDADGNEIAFNDDAVDRYSEIIRTCNNNPLPAGTYIILVDEYNNNDVIDQYEVTLNTTSCDPTVTETPTPTATPAIPLAVTTAGSQAQSSVSGWHFLVALLALQLIIVMVMRSRTNA